MWVRALLKSFKLKNEKICPLVFYLEPHIISRVDPGSRGGQKVNHHPNSPESCPYHHPSAGKSLRNDSMIDTSIPRVLRFCEKLTEQLYDRGSFFSDPEDILRTYF